MATNNTDVNSMLKVGTVLRGVYRIDDYLASGGFGNTYLATNLEFNEHVAIKEFYMKGVSLRNEDSSVSVSHPENVEMFDKLLKTFKREAKRLWKLSMGNAPHVVKVFDLFEENNTSYYVMQHINGRSLSGILKANSKPLDEAWLMDSLLPQMLEALEAIHSNSMWHLDIKPSNIMIDDKGNAYLIDFGSSKQVDPASGNATLSSTLSFTRNYAPLELQEYNLKKIGPWTDMYSLGATLYALATNENPPSAYNILSEGADSFKFVPGAREDLKKLVLWMMSPKAEERPQSVAEVKKFVNGESIPQMTAANLASIGGVPNANNEIAQMGHNSEETIVSGPAAGNQGANQENLIDKIQSIQSGANVALNNGLQKVEQGVNEKLVPHLKGMKQFVVSKGSSIINDVAQAAGIQGEEAPMESNSAPGANYDNSYQNYDNPPKSHKGLVIAGIIALVVLLVVLFSDMGGGCSHSGSGGGDGIEATQYHIAPGDMLDEGGN